MLSIDNWFAIRCLATLKQERVLLASDSQRIQRDHAPKHQTPAPQVPGRLPACPSLRKRPCLRPWDQTAECPPGMPAPSTSGSSSLGLHHHGHCPRGRVDTRARTEPKQETSSAAEARHAPCLRAMMMVVVVSFCALLLHSGLRLLMDMLSARPAGTNASASRKPVGIRLVRIRLFIRSSLLTQVLTNARVILTPNSSKI